MCWPCRSSHQSCSIKKVFLKILQNSQENACASVSFLIKLQVDACNLIKKEILAQVSSCYKGIDKQKSLKYMVIYFMVILQVNHKMEFYVAAPEKPVL